MKQITFDIIIGMAWALFAIILSLILARDSYFAADTPGRALGFLRDIEFDFVSWTLEAVGFKVRQASVDEQVLLPEAERGAFVRECFNTRRALDDIEGQINARYADPAIADKSAATADLRAQQSRLRARLAELQPGAEAILGEQLSVILAEQGLTVGGQPIPPVSFHFTGLPLALIVSPREVIRQDANLDVQGDLPIDRQVALEDRVAQELNVSTLIVPLGGIGTYPTMVDHSSDLNWIASVAAHEWTHNYLTLRPLGINYEASPELRTMNETTAEIAGNELGALIMARYYADLKPPPAPFENMLTRDQPSTTAQTPAFDFREEMHTTRVTVDALLAGGQVSEAEAYLEERRRFLWDRGHQIRKLNQAYFAFYGAYTASAPGEEGFDPVGPAVRLLRRRSPTLRAFVDTMAGFTEFGGLQKYLILAR